MTKGKRTDKRGFTLLELLLVIILISILAALTIPRFVGRSESAKKAAADADINVNMSIALDLYEIDNGLFPTTEQGLTALLETPETSPHPRGWQGPYVKQASRLRDPWGNPYKYVSPGEHNPQGYDLSSFGPDELEGTADDITNWVSPDEKLE